MMMKEKKKNIGAPYNDVTGGISAPNCIMNIKKALNLF
jgi:hypothetical protein